MRSHRTDDLGLGDDALERPLHSLPPPSYSLRYCRLLFYLWPLQHLLLVQPMDWGVSFGALLREARIGAERADLETRVTSPFSSHVYRYAALAWSRGGITISIPVDRRRVALCYAGSGTRDIWKERKRKSRRPVSLEDEPAVIWVKETVNPRKEQAGKETRTS